MATNPDLPDGILLEIFSRLPTKCVGKCRCLSKLWRRDLSTTHFINKHLITRQQTIAHHHQENLALVTEDGDLHIVTSPFKNEEQVKVWTGEWCNNVLNVFGACNGLVLLVPRDAQYLCLVNPITRQQVNVVRAIPPWTDWHYSLVFGFGYDCLNDDFKVVALHYSYPRATDNYYNDMPKSVTLVDVFSVKRGVWNRLDSNLYPYDELIPLGHNRGVFVNGSMHWIIRKRDSGFYCHIAAFDLAKEVFCKIPIPAEFDPSRPYGFPNVDFSGIAVIGGCLSIVYNLTDGIIHHCNPSSCAGTDIWMMKEYGVADSWVRFHIAGHDFGLSIVPLCLVGDEQLMCYTDRDALVECDLKDGTTKKLIVGGKDYWYWGGIAFVDSLISPSKRECDNDSG